MSPDDRYPFDVVTKDLLDRPGHALQDVWLCIMFLLLVKSCMSENGRL
jgi:hypothetical protein